MLEVLLMGLGVGAAGSFHCVGMCGPLALALPVSSKTKAGRLFSILFYNLGRTFTYFSMGMLLGFAGKRIAITGYQQTFSIAVGVLILTILLMGRVFPAIPFVVKFQNRLKKTLAVFLSKKNNAINFFIIGILNGLLPCGLVYMAIASALVIGNPVYSGLFMAAFGLGTIPLMGLLMLTKQHISFSLRARMKKIVPFFIMIVAVLMILRGLNLGIPFVSPAFSENTTMQAVECHPGQ